ncbi:MAG: hypothetical protein JW841_08550 [Deltaproteobacteria bacterium]|nr:hypothetical protein [Deltaproteobacteria bacterium]
MTLRCCRLLVLVSLTTSKLLFATPPLTSNLPQENCADFNASIIDTPLIQSNKDNLKNNTLRIQDAQKYLNSCAQFEIAALTEKLISFAKIADYKKINNSSLTAQAAFLQKWALTHGLLFKIVGDNYAWEISYGTGEKLLGLVTHIDGSINKNSNSYNKINLATALIVLAAIRRKLVKMRGEVVLIIGLDTNLQLEKIHQYISSQTLPQQIITLDGTLPVTIANNGQVYWHLAATTELSTKTYHTFVANAQAGQKTNGVAVIPDQAHMQLMPGVNETLAQLQLKVAAAIDQEKRHRGSNNGFKISMDVDNSLQCINVHVFGKSAPAFAPEHGYNALWPLASIAQLVRVENQGFGLVLKLIAKKFDDDFYGYKLGLAYKHPFMGRLVVAPTHLSGQNGQAYLDIAMSRPMGMTTNEFSNKLDIILKRLKHSIGPELYEYKPYYISEARYVDEETPLVQTLLDIYRKETDSDSAKPSSIRSDNYMHIFAGAIAIGASLPQNVAKKTPDTSDFIAANDSASISTITLLSHILFSVTTQLTASSK